MNMALNIISRGIGENEVAIFEHFRSHALPQVTLFKNTPLSTRSIG